MEPTSVNVPRQSEQQVFPDVASHEPTPAWEMLEAGRYRPRRIRGSYRGRELG